MRINQNKVKEEIHYLLHDLYTKLLSSFVYGGITNQEFLKACECTTYVRQITQNKPNKKRKREAKIGEEETTKEPSPYFLQKIKGYLKEEPEIRFMERDTIEYWVTRIFEEFLTYGIRMGTAREVELQYIAEAYHKLMYLIDRIETRKEAEKKGRENEICT